MPRVVIEHKASFIWIRSGVVLKLDGLDRATIKPNSRADILVAPGRHRIWATAKRSTSPILDFHVDEREELGFICLSSGIFGKRISLRQAYTHKHFDRFGGQSIQASGPEWAAVLGIQPGASPSEIRQAYLKLIDVYHPDRVRHLPREAQLVADQQAQRINVAYQEAKRADRNRVV